MKWIKKSTECLHRCISKVFIYDSSILKVDFSRNYSYFKKNYPYQWQIKTKTSNFEPKQNSKRSISRTTFHIIVWKARLAKTWFFRIASFSDRSGQYITNVMTRKSPLMGIGKFEFMSLLKQRDIRYECHNTYRTSRFDHTCWGNIKPLGNKTRYTLYTGWL